MISIKKSVLLGVVLPIKGPHEKEQVSIEIMDFLDVKETLPDDRKILVYPVHRLPTQERLDAVKKAQARRKAYWTRDLIKKGQYLPPQE